MSNFSKLLSTFSQKGVVGLLLLVIVITLICFFSFMMYTYQSSLKANQDNIAAILEQNKTNNTAISESTKALITLTSMLEGYIRSYKEKNTFRKELFDRITLVEDSHNELSTILIRFGEKNKVVWTSEINKAIKDPRSKIGKLKEFLFKSN